MEINIDPSCSSSKDSDRDSSSSLGPDVTMAPDGSKGHPNQHVSQTSVWSQMTDQTPGTETINSDTDCYRVRDLDMVLSSIPGLDNTMAIATCSSVATQIVMAWAVVWPSDTSIATGYRIDHRHSCELYMCVCLHIIVFPIFLLLIFFPFCN